MSVKRNLKAFVYNRDRLQKAYFFVRYWRASKISRWVADSLKMMEHENLNSFCFENGSAYVRSNFDCEFKYDEKKLGGLLGVERKIGFENTEILILRKLLTDGETFLDIGSNFGYYACHLCKLFPKSRVHCFEPISDTVNMLKINLVRNKLSHQAYLHELALSDLHGSVLMTSDRHAGNYILSEGSYDGNKNLVQTNTIDNLFSTNDHAPIGLIKCDVEGAELNVVNGGINLLQNEKPLLLFEIDSDLTKQHGNSAEDVFSLLETLGYCAYAVPEFAKKIGSRSYILWSFFELLFFT